MDEAVSYPLLLVLFSPFLGGFAATVAVNWEGSTGALLDARSRCSGCGRTLGIVDLLPVVGWFVTRGRCRRCGQRIDPVHVALEIAFPVIAVVSITFTGPFTGTLTGTLTTCVLGWAAVLLAALDHRHRLLPDLVTLPLGALGVAAAAFGLSVPLVDSLFGAAVGFVTLTAVDIAYRRLRGRSGIGGGDVKLFAAAGAWLGPWALPLLLVGAGGAALVMVLIWRGLGRRVAKDTVVPFGLVLAPATWIAWMLLVSPA
jgi:leader peptidase (prepilin peptidase)/N-methyltransferase